MVHFSSSAAQEHFATRQHFDRHFNIRTVEVLPGEYFVTRDEVMVTTLLGSCVSVCLYDPFAKVGGMNHFLLPRGDGVDLLSSSGRYGVHAMEMLIGHLLELGAQRNSLHAKLFGGANVIKEMTQNIVGHNNAHFVRAYMHNKGIAIEASDLLGIYPRRVNFFPVTGTVLMKKLTNHYDNALLDDEMRYQKSVIDSQNDWRR